jgi:predicted flap endonuclease-1-like 5' DNA nuclease
MAKVRYNDVRSKLLKQKGENLMTKLIVVEGIGEAYAQKLREAGIATVEALLAAGASPKGRQEIAEKTGIGHKLILEWVNRADLFRIKGIGEEYSDLLEAAGVDTVPELAQRNAENLFAKFGEVNEAEKLVRRLPTLAQVANWIDQAKALRRIVTY